MIQRLALVLCMSCLYACNPSKTRLKNVVSDVEINNGYEFTSSILYAKGFTIEKKENYKKISVYNPWKENAVLREYALIPRNESIPDNLPDNLIVVKVPVNSVCTFSNTHIGSIVTLGLEDKLLGMTRAEKVYNKSISEKVTSGEISNLGGAHNKNIDFEKMIDLAPELVILSALNGMKADEGQMEELGFKLAYSLNWMEETPLGRAEWLKFTAAFFNKEKMADSLFKQIEINYKQLKAKVVSLKTKPNVLLGWSYKGIWYVPGGKNYMVSYLRDAGANYFLFDDETRGNIPMSVESVLDQCSQADIWIYPGTTKSLADIENNGEIFTQFAAYQNKEIYNIYKRSNSNGGSDWWETGSLRPDLVLKDFIKVLHPDLLAQDTTYYINKLN
ncbi:ABC transporter substrate-binding protein [Labilibaculum sp. A4]|uniref:ABC transporter substrate-binding protein n=1 Tax=Labilibaculum euxinus TaxID=2686357 RepID=UPI000F6256C8|nr:ABC transporter substrate-binding protein [Labilibaculum euxinus]MDQ1771890.1 ABC transporter substrate-binding protein [Labilibaculum euxinus]MWN77795.1 ABC transporter substrate-binding protein [Labilibaculum euxinus]